MDRLNSFLVSAIFVAYVCLLHFRSPHAQVMPIPCDVHQKCSCCSRNETCLSKSNPDCLNDCYNRNEDGKCKQPCTSNRDAGCNGCCTNNLCIIACKVGYWGAKCIKKCPSNCISCSQYYQMEYECYKCIPGKYGKNCTKRCPAKCFNTTCEKEDGLCNSCTAGYYGSTCNMTCPSNCAKNLCFQENGSCTDGCKNNFDGELCDTCRSGRYGEGCSKTCSSGCKNDLCYGEHGQCTHGCKENFSDSQYCCANNLYCTTCSTTSACKLCMNNTYGSQCELKCPQKCNGSCNMFTGKCTTCLDGYYGDKCDIPCNNLCRYSVCDMSDGQCSFGCTNNSTARGCLEENTKPMSEENLEAKTNPTAAVAGATVSTLALLLILFSVFVIRRRYQNRPGDTMSRIKEDTEHMDRNNDQEMGNDNEANNEVDVCTDGHGEGDVAEAINPHESPERMTNLYHNDTGNASSITGIRLNSIHELISKPHVAYQNEFKMLPIGLIKPHSDACKPENMTKNRYNAVYPYDENRVRVSSGQFDYINASYINGFERPRAYIAALGPTKKTIGNFAVFWKMVWQEKVEVIVMLTRLVESSGMKCDQYWPDNETVVKYGDMSVKCECEDVYAEFTARQFTITLKKQSRLLHHVQFTAWPDKGVPDDIISIINLRQRIVRIGCRFDGPQLVHCSAGIGRTGTYIALDILSKQGAAEKAVDVFQCVLNLRQQRVNMVQILDQYKFLHYAIAWTFMVDIDQFPASSFQELSWVERKLSDMYEMLQLDIFQETDEDSAAIVSNMGNTYANRENSDIPDNRHIVTLWPGYHAAAEATGYINAVYIDGFRRRNRFIAAQTPLPDTVSDFLKMIIQCEPSCIIDIEPVAENQLDVGKYLPAANQSFQGGLHPFRVIGRDKQNSYTKRTLEVSANEKPRSVIRTVEHFTFTKWPEWTTVPEDATDIVDFIRDIETTLANTEKEGPILIHCLNGAIRSGLLCGVWLAIERLEYEQRVNVLNTLRQVKHRRRHTIVNKEQLKFCFECVSTYANRFESNVYSNQ